MATERYIDLQLIKPLSKGSAIKGKISLKKLLKEYLKNLNVGYIDPCCNPGDDGFSNGDGNFVSVAQFGAIGNGVTDDTTSIQAALDSGNPMIFFPAGTYNITSSLLINSNTILYGYGAVLFRNAAIDNMLRNNSDGTTGNYGANENISIYGLTLDGNKTTFPSNSTLIAFGHVTNVIVKDCEFRAVPGAWHGLELNGVQNSIVEGCYFHDCSISEQLQLDLMANTAVFPWFGPYDNSPCKNISIVGNRFVGSGSTAWGLGSHSFVDTFHHTDILISDNTFRNFANAINLYNYKNVVISNNIVDGCVFGISAFLQNVVGLTNWVVEGNHFRNATGNGRPITIFNIKGISITGNITDTSNDAGIHLQGCDGFSITSNIIRNASTNVSTDFPVIDVVGCSNGYISNNVATKSAAGLGSGVNTIRINTSGIYTTNNNITIEDNTCTTLGATTAFTIAATATNVIVGSNTINGKILPAIFSKTTNYTYTPTDRVLNVDTTAGDVTITINPTIFNKLGLTIRKTSADANDVIITPSTGTINGVASVSLTTQDQAALITSDWTNLDAIIK